MKHWLKEGKSRKTGCLPNKCVLVSWERGKESILGGECGGGFELKEISTLVSCGRSGRAEHGPAAQQEPALHDRGRAEGTHRQAQQDGEGDGGGEFFFN